MKKRGLLPLAPPGATATGEDERADFRAVTPGITDSAQRNLLAEPPVVARDERLAREQTDAAGEVRPPPSGGHVITAKHLEPARRHRKSAHPIVGSLPGCTERRVERHALHTRHVHDLPAQSERQALPRELETVTSR